MLFPMSGSFIHRNIERCTIGKTIKDCLLQGIWMSQILLFSIFQWMCCRTARVNSILQFQAALFGVLCQAPGLVLLWLYTPMFGTMSPKKVRWHLVYILIGICPSLVTVYLNEVWAYAFSCITSLIFGRMCLLKYDSWSSITSLPESKKHRISIPLALMHTLGHLATAHCIISIFVSAKMEALLLWQIKLFSSFSVWGPLFSPLVWLVTKGGLSFPIVSVANWCYFSQTACSQWPVSSLI